MGTKKVVDVNGAGMDKYIKDITKIVEKVDPKSINGESGGKDGANKKPTSTTTTTGTTTKKVVDVNGAGMDKYIKDITKIVEKVDPKSINGGKDGANIKPTSTTTT